MYMRTYWVDAGTIIFSDGCDETQPEAELIE